jgi:hypothetical protein
MQLGSLGYAMLYAIRRLDALAHMVEVADVEKVRSTFGSRIGTITPSAMSWSKVRTEMPKCARMGLRCDFRTAPKR